MAWEPVWFNDAESRFPRGTWLTQGDTTSTSSAASDCAMEVSTLKSSRSDCAPSGIGSPFSSALKASALRPRLDDAQGSMDGRVATRPGWSNSLLSETPSLRFSLSTSSLHLR